MMDMPTPPGSDFHETTDLPARLPHAQPPTSHSYPTLPEPPRPSVSFRMLFLAAVGGMALVMALVVNHAVLFYLLWTTHQTRAENAAKLQLLDTRTWETHKQVTATYDYLRRVTGNAGDAKPAGPEKP